MKTLPVHLAGHGLGLPPAQDANWSYHDQSIQTYVKADTSRPVWPSCPSYGWTSGVDRLWGLPNGKPLIVAAAPADRPAYPFPMEAHGPCKHVHRVSLQSAVRLLTNRLTTDVAHLVTA